MFRKFPQSAKFNKNSYGAKKHFTGNIRIDLNTKVPRLTNTGAPYADYHISPSGNSPLDKFRSTIPSGNHQKTRSSLHPTQFLSQI